MLVIRSIQELKELAFDQGCKGLVPTMGALHLGHLSLIERAKKECDVVISSIFVNPLQFNNKTDLETYPIDIDRDIKKLRECGCHAVFIPEAHEMYSGLPLTHISFGELENTMEGAFRKNHFNGVAVVVSKLFNLIQPDNAYFGQKDLQQAVIIQQLVKDLSFPVRILICPTIREKDGLALSSRNVKLSPKERQQAVSLYQALLKAKKLLLENESVQEVFKSVLASFESYPDARLEYFEVVDVHTLRAVKNIKEHKQIALCIAAFIGNTRLIDNLYLFS